MKTDFFTLVEGVHSNFYTNTIDFSSYNSGGTL